MSSYGRNFEFRVPPESEGRQGRYYLAGGAAVALGAPVKVDAVTYAENDLGLTPVVLATGAQAKPNPGMGGILVYEYGPAAFAGDDPYLTTYSDKSTAPAGAAVQVIRDPDVKIVLRNTAATTFLQTRSYAARTMVAGLGATVTLAVGDMLTPGTGDDSAGYWVETATAANAWLIVTKVDNTRGEIEAKINF